MSELLKLTLSNVDQKTIYINPAHIYHISPQGTGCYVHMGEATSGMGHYIKESTDTVVRMVRGDASDCTVEPEAFERMTAEFNRQFGKAEGASV